MSRIDSLMAQMCPEGVQFRHLRDCILRNVGGGTPSKSRSDYWNGAIPWASVGDITGCTLRLTRTRQTITEVGLDNSSSNLIPAGYVVVAVKIAPGAMRVVESDVAINQDIRGLLLRDELDPYFLAYYFKTISLIGNGTIVKGITSASLEQVRVPVPPLEVQHEIVRTLDQFTKLEADLEAELDAEMTARQFQFNHYRDSLFSFDGADCEWLTLKEVALDFGRGKSKHRPRNDPKLYGGPYPFIQTGDVRNSDHLITSYSQTYNDEGLAQSKLWPRGTICITIAANIAETGILDFDACFPDSVIGMVVSPKKTSQHFVEYLLQSLKADLAAKGRGSAQANINLATFEEELFPFPPLREQERIVSVLDRYVALLNDHSSGLAAEHRTRRKQYEYYRGRVLTFQESRA